MNKSLFKIYHENFVIYGYTKVKYGLSSLKNQYSDLQSKIVDFYCNYSSIEIIRELILY